MKKVCSLAVITVCLGFYVSAQTLESASHSTTGYIKPDGTIENSNHSTVGYIKHDGAIENSNHSTMGYILSSGEIENSNHRYYGICKKRWHSGKQQPQHHRLYPQRYR